jgi:hypothetical protein
MAIVGTLVAESLRLGVHVEGLRLTTTKIARVALADVGAGQPSTWTFIEFEVPDEDAGLLSRALESALQEEGGWYCDFRSAEETFVVFAGRTFRYPRGDGPGRVAAAEFGRSVGVPESQLDWPV